MAEKKGILAWLQDNLRLIASAFIVLFLAFLVYSYASKNNRMDLATLDTVEDGMHEVVDASDEAVDALEDTAAGAVTGAGATLDALTDAVETVSDTDETTEDHVEEKKPRKSFRELIGLGGNRDDHDDTDQDHDTEDAYAEDTDAPVVQQNGSTITVKALAGDGVTHLARKAAASYLADQSELSLSGEQKVYVEDYLRKALGAQQLTPGDDVSFGADMIAQAITHAQNLSPQQIANLTKYAHAVRGL